MTVEFIRAYSLYRAGDKAGFSSKKEKELVKAGITKAMKKPQVDKIVRNSHQKSKTYKCDCGREFDSPQGIAAHSRFCKKK